MANTSSPPTALWTLRSTLLASILIFAADFVLGAAGLIDAELSYVIGIFSGMAIGISAILCVALQLAGMFRRRRRG